MIAAPAGPDESPAWSDRAFAAIAQLAHAHAGLAVAPARRPSIELAVRRAMRRAGVDEPARYHALVAAGGPALDDLLAELTVGETYFFRDPAQFAFVRSTVLPAHASGRPLRVWSAACATGEEPYSLAITLREAGVASRVLGTDVARHRLRQARRARYRPWALRGVSDAVVRRWFREVHGEWALDPAVRAAVEFRHLNLVEDRWPSAASGVHAMDLVFCRNVLIYFDRATIARVAERLLATLADDGWLLLAASDPPLGEFVPCEAVPTGGGLAYRRLGPGTRPGGAARWRATDGEPAGRATTPVRWPAPPVALDGAPATWPDAPPNVSPDATSSTAPAAATPAGATFDVWRNATPDASPTTTPRSTPDVSLIPPASAPPSAAPDDAVAALVREVRALADAGDGAEAERRCVAALERHPTVADLHWLHAVLLADAGHPLAGAEAARRALYLDPDLVVAHLTLADALRRLGRAEAARRAFDAAERRLAALDPSAPVPHADGEPAGRLLALARAGRALLGESGA